MESFPENFGSELSRRRFLGASIGGIPWASLALSEEETELQSGLRAWVDTLIPSEDPHPGAGDLGVHLAIEKFSESTHNYPELLRRGTAWADQQAGEAKRFAILDEPERVKIVARAEESELMSVPWMYFFFTRRDAMFFYYGNPETWEEVGFPRSPQPIGFPDFANAPDSKIQ